MTESKLMALGPNTWWRSYSFRPGSNANCFVMRHEGELMVVSAACGMTETDFAELDALGSVTALIPPNGFHHLGIPDWCARYPEAKIFADAKTAKRVAKKHPSLGTIGDLAAFSASLPDHMSIAVPNFPMRFPDVAAHIKDENGTHWFVNDMMVNQVEVPKGVAGFVLKVSGSAPGLKFMNLAPMFLGAKKPVLKKWLREGFEAHAPSSLVPGHGVVAADSNLPAQLGQILA